MSTYTTIAALQKRVDPVMLASLADDATSTIRTQSDAATSLALAATIAVIDQAILDASNFIDSWLRDRVDLTLSANQAALEYHAATITLYYLYRRRYAEGDSNPMYTSYQASVSWLKDVGRGQVRLDDNPLQPDTLTACNTTNTTRVFDSTEIQDY